MAGAAGFDDHAHRPLVLGQFYGVRQWARNEEGRLKGVHGSVWEDGENLATCKEAHEVPFSIRDGQLTEMKKQRDKARLTFQRLASSHPRGIKGLGDMDRLAHDEAFGRFTELDRQLNDPSFKDCGCVVPETLVLTADLRWVQAGDLMVGERLLAFDEHSSGPSASRKYREAVVACTDRDMLPCYDLEFEDGSTARVSSDHRWLVYSGNKAAHWVRTDELRAGDLRASRIVKPFGPWETDRSYEAGYVAAAFDGEGCLMQVDATYQNQVHFAQVDNAMLAETERCLKELGFDYGHTIQPRGYGPPRVDGSPRQDMHRLAIGKRPELLRLLGSVRPVRLLDRFRPERLGRLNMQKRVRLVSKTFAGEQEIVKLGTTSGTYVTEAGCSHNCGFWAYWKFDPHEFHLGEKPVVGIVEGYGKTIRGSRGFRCAKARIVALHCAYEYVREIPGNKKERDESQPGWHQVFSADYEQGTADAIARLAQDEEELQRNYPGAVVYSTLEAMMKMHPPGPLPE